MSEKSKLRGLTLSQPWPAAWPEKDVENRTWHPSRLGLGVGDYLALHGGKMPSSKAAREEAYDALCWINDRLEDSIIPRRPNTYPGFDPVLDALECNLIEGIFAVVRIKEVVQDSSSDWAMKGQYHWVLEDCVMLGGTIECRGAQGLWGLPDDVLTQVKAAWKVARVQAQDSAPTSPAPHSDGLPEHLRPMVEAAMQSAGQGTMVPIISAYGSGLVRDVDEYVLEWYATWVKSRSDDSLERLEAMYQALSPAAVTWDELGVTA